MSGLPGSKSLYGSAGLVLIEVLMAVVLLTVLVVPLVGGVLSAARAADGIREPGIDASGSEGGFKAGEAWEWGAAVSSAWWRPGPTLHIQTEKLGGTEARGAEGLVAGLWAEGWFLGEWAPGDDGAIRVGAPALAAVIGGELLVRVRSSDGAWGPPWRLVVPLADGLSVLSDSVGSGMSGETVAHVPALANPALRPSWTAVPPEADPPGLPFLLPAASPGISAIDLDGRRQSWKAEEGRGLDVYF